jgi:hypothetical protein
LTSRAQDPFLRLSSNKRSDRKPPPNAVRARLAEQGGYRGQLSGTAGDGLNASVAGNQLDNHRFDYLGRIQLGRLLSITDTNKSKMKTGSTLKSGFQ